MRGAGGVHRAVYRTSGGRIAGEAGNLPVLLLTTTGRKTGKQRTTPLVFVHALRTSPVSSVDPLSTTIISKLAKVCANIVSIAFGRSRPPLRTGKITLTSGMEAADVVITQSQAKRE